MFSCTGIKKKFYEHLEGNLTISEKVKIETHLERCVPCSRELLRIKRLFELLPGAEIPEPSEEFWRRFDAELKGKISSVTLPASKRYALKPVRSILSLLNLKPVVSMALALIFILVAGVTIYSFRPGRARFAQAERRLSAEELLEKLYLLDELSPEDIKDVAIEDLTDEELEGDLPFLYRLDPTLLTDYPGPAEPLLKTSRLFALAAVG